MATAVIVDAVRTPGGKRGGKLKDWHPVDLAAEVLKELVKRNNLDTATIDDVIIGCVSQTGEQSLNVGRNALLAAGFPEHACKTRCRNYYSAYSTSLRTVGGYGRRTAWE